MRLAFSSTTGLVLGVTVAGLAWAEGSLDKAVYDRAARLVPPNLERLAFTLDVMPQWIRKTSRFWYRREARDGREFVLIEPAEARRRPLFDHKRLADALSKATGAPVDPRRLPFETLELTEDEGAVDFEVKDTGWTCDLKAYHCRGRKPDGPPRGESPDKKWVAVVKGPNLFVRGAESTREHQLTFDGEERASYATPSPSLQAMVEQQTGEVSPPVAVSWSPDSRHLATHRLDRRRAQDLTLVQSSPPHGLRPRAFDYTYSLAGEAEVSMVTPVLFDVGSRKRIDVDLEPMPLYLPRSTAFQWSPDGARAYQVRFERGYKAAKVVEIDAATGRTRVVLEERSETYVDPQMLDVRPVGNGEILVSSERDGWNHLYLHDVATGSVRCQLTRGEWVVRGTLHVDEKAGQVHFYAGGREPGRDPYYVHAYRVGLDGSGLALLTPEDAAHEVRMSPDGRFFVDTHSRVDRPPVSVLRRSADGAMVMELERGDVEPLLATGWKAPEPFKVKARDGRTDVYGALFRPSDFDPSRKYPVIDHIYNGPQAVQTPKTFAQALRNPATPLAELGFLVVTIDGMGTAMRSKAFHEVSYRNLGDSGLADHIAGLRQLAERTPSLDLDRVGIFGHSAGGYDTLRALLTHPEFYKVGVASGGNHDHRLDKSWWNELWMGYPAGPHYAEQSNVTLAGKLQGKLLLAHGELDDNVHPAATMRVVDALVQANKDFELLILPNKHHALTGPYFARRRWDFFVRHLMGVEPPREYPLVLEERPGGRR
jgi:dipeptidyl aminopeptidase/acylaminoacyl peptidase